MLVKHPLLTTVSVVSLGLGIPAGLVPGLIFDGLEAPLPFEDGDRIRILRYRSLETSGTVAPTTYDAGVWQETLSSFQSLGAVRPVEHNLDSGSGLPAPVIGAEVTGSIFSMLRVRPLRGRTIQADDAAPGAPAVVLIGEDLWRARLAADPEAVGRVVSIGGEPYSVVGVMPSGFGFPERQQMWLPLRDTPAGEPADGIPVEVYGRLADDATAVTADAELEAVLGRLASAFPDAYRRLTAEVAPASFAGQLGLGDGRLRALHSSGSCGSRRSCSCSSHAPTSGCSSSPVRRRAPASSRCAPRWARAGGASSLRSSPRHWSSPSSPQASDCCSSTGSRAAI
jgi:hypothetical protein